MLIRAFTFGCYLSYYLFKKLVSAAIAKDLQNCVVSYFVSQKSMAINCETFILTKETCRALLHAVDKNLTETFMLLWNLG